MSDFKIIYLKCGALKGQQIVSKLGKKYVAFKGIPYAKPPVGNLRFKPPQPLSNWEGVRDATKEGNRAPHFDMVSKEFCGSEDCLYLNIYSPEIDKKEQIIQLKAVMFWIHGGGFAYGHADADVYGPDLLVQHDVILVTVNYRLGVLGFLNLELEEASGNMGMKDQVAALRWVQNEIEAFGGDPNNVTIFGNSAGGVSVHLHMLSDMSKGLFQKAIAQSGNALCNWSFSLNHKERAFALGSLLGLKAKDEKELLNFFLTIPAVQFAELQDEVMTMADHIREVDQAFVPSVEKNFANTESFISALPKVLLQNGKLNAVPLLTGVNSHEGLSAIYATKKYPEFIKEVDSGFHSLLPVYELTDEKVKKVRDFYFSDKDISENEDQLIKFYTDIVFLLPTFESIKLQLNMNRDSKIFLYHFSYDGKFGWYKRLMAKHRGISKEDIPSGTHHCDELGYLFSNNILNLQNLSEPSSELKVANILTTMWTNFAKTGEPSVPDSSITWLPTDVVEHLNFLNICENLSLENENGSLNKRLKFWNELGISTFF